jgi:hypothetical protein
MAKDSEESDADAQHGEGGEEGQGDEETEIHEGNGRSR